MLFNIVDTVHMMIHTCSCVCTAQAYYSKPFTLKLTLLCLVWKETSALHQTIGTLENDKARAEAKVIEVQRELEDVKKGKNQEMKQLKAEIEDLKSKLDNEMAQVGQLCTHNRGKL